MTQATAPKEAFEEPTILLRLERSYPGNEAIQLEKGSYRGHPVYALRTVWKNADGQWKWSTVKADQKGRCWSRIGLKPRELIELAKALTEAATLAFLDESGDTL